MLKNVLLVLLDIVTIHQLHSVLQIVIPLNIGIQLQAAANLALFFNLLIKLKFKTGCVVCLDSSSCVACSPQYNKNGSICTSKCNAG